MAIRSTEEIAADFTRRAELALEQVPGKIAALIRQASSWQTLALTLETMATARDRETIRRETGYFLGLAQGNWAATPPGERCWSLEEWEAVTDYGNEMEARALLALEAAQ